MRRLFVVATWFLGILALAGCQHEGVTVYPVLFCKEACEVLTSSGETVKRRLVAQMPESYSAIPATQDVLVQSHFGVVQSLPRDQKYECRVRTPRDWECTRDGPAPGAYARAGMINGAFSSMKLPWPNDILTHVGRCQWNHIRWRNYWGFADPRSVWGGLFGWAVGCVVPSP